MAATTSPDTEPQRCDECGKESPYRTGLQPLVVLGFPGQWAFCSLECAVKHLRPDLADTAR